jgi:hypothetical protein
MARYRPSKSVIEAGNKARRDIGEKVRDMIDTSRRQNSPAGRMYPNNVLPAQMSGPAMLPAGKPSDSPTLSSADVHKIESAFGRSSPKARAVMDALRSAGLLGGRRPGTPATGADRGPGRGAVSPLGGQAS